MTVSVRTAGGSQAVDMVATSRCAEPPGAAKPCPHDQDLRSCVPPQYIALLLAVPLRRADEVAREELG